VTLVKKINVQVEHSVRAKENGKICKPTPSKKLSFVKTYNGTLEYYCIKIKLKLN